MEIEPMRADGGLSAARERGRDDRRQEERPGRSGWHERRHSDSGRAYDLVDDSPRYERGRHDDRPRYGERHVAERDERGGYSARRPPSYDDRRPYERQPIRYEEGRYDGRSPPGYEERFHPDRRHGDRRYPEGGGGGRYPEGGARPRSPELRRSPPRRSSPPRRHSPPPPRRSSPGPARRHSPPRHEAGREISPRQISPPRGHPPASQDHGGGRDGGGRDGDGLARAGSGDGRGIVHAYRFDRGINRHRWQARRITMYPEDFARLRAAHLQGMDSTDR